jgi:hypothetical protein
MVGFVGAPMVSRHDKFTANDIKDQVRVRGTAV